MLGAFFLLSYLVSEKKEMIMLVDIMGHVNWSFSLCVPLHNACSCSPSPTLSFSLNLPLGRRGVVVSVSRSVPPLQAARERTVTYFI